MESSLATQTSTQRDAPESFRYWVMRFVPNVLRGEFINVGVIVGGQDEWSIRAVDRANSRNILGVDLTECRAWVDELREEVEATQRLDIPGTVGAISRSRMERLSVFYNNTVQLVDGGPVAIDSADHGAEMLYDLLVATPEHEPQQRRKTQMNQGLEAVLDSWRARSPNRSFIRRPVVTVGRTSQRFDFSIAASSVALSQTWSFGGSDRQSANRLVKDIRSWSLAVHKMRSNGGLLSAGRDSKAPLEINRDIAIGVLVERPQHAILRDVYAEAQETWAELGIREFRDSQAYRVPEVLVPA
ncbi:DUF3037 domain-containing protein [Nesterenkonia jeotgali]|uniref:DUF3037 domain-containing protein n=1 Tax=Nesterenkonia jeotgali TaxID=317018 RepID=A0A839FFC6_9MICC|nr:DUF3037 domain-containing protein [Nesterenkonia jeotgali]MBA8920410.1 hypothetical protein [Nesterenkonia jeotgali]